MLLILRSFSLSFGVAVQMILPAIGVYIASVILVLLLNPITGGLASVVSGPILTAFLALLGIRVALAQLGERNRTDYQFLFLYAVMFAVIYVVAKGVAITLANLVAIVFAEWRAGGMVSLRNFTHADQSLQFAFAFNALSAKGIAALVLFTTLFAVLGVPLANAARSAGAGERGRAIFFGPGRQFIPLFCVYAVVLFLQFFVGLIHFVVAVIPFVLSVFGIIFFQTLPDFEPEVILYGALASFALFWLHAWTWSACALALRRTDEHEDLIPRVPQPVAEEPQVDIRALRKSRE